MMVGLTSIIITLCVLALSSFTLADAQPPPLVAKQSPQLQPPPLVAEPPVTIVVRPVPSTSKPPVKHHHHREHPHSRSHCEIPVNAPYFVKRSKQCWCSMESYRNRCFEKIWRSATTYYDFKKVDKKCCDAFRTADKNCGLIFERYPYFVYRLKQHCSQFN
ncbi:hypothetical protein HRI_004085100 [Hibiscus trionum]|uniref:Prolamin-like domain-containing protein n=1 Tax=Hibiscus trionum TaxID=183268 RepID=A0A9W7IZJ8_HIBTR|nr:hypothetical protein HRI_004085000 [Hibiscus trionum]GMJ04159.1 hypothetical protein HRI_004085100 [Hibiscus trionum]